MRPTRYRRSAVSLPRNQEVDGAFAEAVVEQFAEVVIAPGYDDAAREVFARKKNLRVLEAQPADRSGLVVSRCRRRLSDSGIGHGVGGRGAGDPNRTEAE